jgi:hypothetical protein
MVEGRGGLCFAAEASLEGGVSRMIDTQHLDRDDPAKPKIAAAAYLGHTAAAEHFAQLVAIPEESRLGHHLPFPSFRSKRTVLALLVDACIRVTRSR